MKKITALLLALALLLSLTGCSKPAEETETTENTTGTTEIVFWHCMSENAGLILDEQVKLFNETVGKENNIHVTAVYQGAYADATAKKSSAA